MSVVTVTIMSDGSRMPPEYELLHLDITTEFNRIAYAELGLQDGNAATQEFKVSDSNFFEPGRKLEIKLRYEDKPNSEKTVFNGIVVKQGLQVSMTGSLLVVEACHEAIKMTSARNSAVFEDMSDSEVIKKLLGKNGIEAGKIQSSTAKHKSLVQYQVTDWDFIMSRAEANGFLLNLSDEKVSVIAPDDRGKKKQTFKYGIDDVFDFDVEADARQQYGRVESISWDLKTQKLTNAAKAKDIQLSPGNFSPSKLGKALGGEKATLLSAVVLDEKEVKAWADGRMSRSRLSFVKGRFSVPGTATISTGDIIGLEGIGKRFSGNVLVSGVRHRVNGDGWMTDLQFGLSGEPFSATPNVTEAKAAGLLPGVNGLQIGIIAKYAEDPEKLNRIKVILPALNDGQNGAVWSRLATLDAGNERGAIFWPEAGDEVIVGFLNDDPRQSVILGSAYSSKNQPPFKNLDKNPEKGIITREGMKIVFDDEKKQLSILTSDKNSITVNEKDKIIEIKDANNNVFKLDQNGITIESGKDVVVKAKGNLQFQATGNVEIKGQKIDVT